jgi:hypothetical protein
MAQKQQILIVKKRESLTNSVLIGYSHSKTAKITKGSGYNE